MKGRATFIGLIAFLLLSSTGQAMPQSGGGHTLFGDFKVDEGEAGEDAPITFHIILYTVTGNIVSRQAITNHGRYRFLNISNGEYVIVVELENREVARLPVMVQSPTKTLLRHDIAMEWRAPPVKTGGQQTGVVSAAEVYDRTPANESRFKEALAAMKKNDFAKAISLLREIVDDDPKDFVAWTALGSLHFNKDSSKAEAAYLRALEAKPSYSVALLNLGKIRLTRKNFEGAIEALTRAVHHQPQSADANYLLGEAYLQIKKGSKAVGYLYEALKLDPIGHAEAHLRLAALYNAVGLKDKAVSEYEQFLSKKPDHPANKNIREYIRENKKN